MLRGIPRVSTLVSVAGIASLPVQLQEIGLAFAVQRKALELQAGLSGSFSIALGLGFFVFCHGEALQA